MTSNWSTTAWATRPPTACWSVSASDSLRASGQGTPSHGWAETSSPYLLEGRVDHSHLVAGRVVEAFDEPFVIDGQEMLLRPSVGMAVASSDEPDLAPEALVKRADMAMYAAKRSRTSGVHTFSPDMTLVDPDVMELAGRPPIGLPATGLRRFDSWASCASASTTPNSIWCTSPNCELSTGRIVGVEALLRWPHPAAGCAATGRVHVTRTPARFDAASNRTGGREGARRRGALGDLGVGTAVAVNLFAPYLRDTATARRALRRS